MGGGRRKGEEGGGLVSAAPNLTARAQAFSSRMAGENRRGEVRRGAWRGSGGWIGVGGGGEEGQGQGRKGRVGGGERKWGGELSPRRAEHILTARAQVVSSKGHHGHYSTTSSSSGPGRIQPKKSALTKWFLPASEAVSFFLLMNFSAAEENVKSSQSIYSSQRKTWLLQRWKCKVHNPLSTPLRWRVFKKRVISKD